jgi:hypothetical protein
MLYVSDYDYLSANPRALIQHDSDATFTRDPRTPASDVWSIGMSFKFQRAESIRVPRYPRRPTAISNEVPAQHGIALILPPFIKVIQGTPKAVSRALIIHGFVEPCHILNRDLHLLE